MAIEVKVTSVAVYFLYSTVVFIDEYKTKVIKETLPSPTFNHL